MIVKPRQHLRNVMAGPELPSQRRANHVTSMTPGCPTRGAALARARRKAEQGAAEATRVALTADELVGGRVRVDVAGRYPVG